MNYMRHLCEIIICTFLISICSCKKNDKIIYSYPITYYEEITDEMSISIPIYITEEYSYYMNKTLIDRSSIISSDEIYNVEIISINKLDSLSNVKKNTKIMYEVNCSFLFVPNSDLILTDSYLEIKFKDGLVCNVKIGEIVLYKNTHNNDISISSLKGLVDEYNDYSILEGIIIKFNTESQIRILNIDTLTPGVNILKNKITTVNDITNVNSLKNIIQDYDPLSTASTSINQLFLSSDEYLIIPLSYEQIKTINTVMLKIEYELQDTQFTYIMEPFKFFSYLSNNEELVSNYFE